MSSAALSRAANSSEILGVLPERPIFTSWALGGGSVQVFNRAALILSKDGTLPYPSLGNLSFSINRMLFKIVKVGRSASAIFSGLQLVSLSRANKLLLLKIRFGVLLKKSLGLVSVVPMSVLLGVRRCMDQPMTSNNPQVAFQD